VCEIERCWYLLSILIHNVDWRLPNTVNKSYASPLVIEDLNFWYMYLQEHSFTWQWYSYYTVS